MLRFCYTATNKINDLAINSNLHEDNVTMGRPSTYTDEIFETICERLENGEVLKQICSDPEMPDRSTVLRWIATDDSRRRKYDQARYACVEYWADEIIQIATDGSKDTVIDEKGRARCDHEWVSRSRLRIETIRHLMAKINPSRYGDKLPEAIQARQMEIEQQQQIAAAPRRIERIILTGVSPGDLMQGPDGEWVPSGADALRERIAELEAALAAHHKGPQTKPPALLEYDPGLPKRMDQEIASQMVRLIRDCVPVDGRREPAAVLDECLSVIRTALRTHFGPTGEVFEMPAVQ